MGDGPKHSIHVPVLREEVVEWLAPKPGSVLVDGTLGGGGHTRALAERVGPGGRIVAMDRDAGALEAASQTLQGLPITTVHGNYCDLPEALASLEIDRVDGIVLDLGLSSDQLADESRGFSFGSTGKLDLRFDVTRGEPAYRLINRLSAEHLANLIYEYGEERYSRRIARKIVERRRTAPVETAADLAELVRRCVPKPKRRGPTIDAATRTFQALRIAVNEELKSLEIILRRAPDCLAPDGRLAIISFHSLEDRRVKEAFRDDPRYDPLVRKPVTASEDEVAGNPRSRSAKLRIARRVP